MQAVVATSASPSDLEFAEVPVPEVGAHELLVSVRAIGVGIHDAYFFSPDVSYPYPIGIEAAGVVAAVGDGVDGHHAGERVTFVSVMQPKGGTWAEYAVVADSSLILPLPGDMSFEQAAALPVAGNTALKALVGAGLESDDRLFIAGGAGAIGSLLIQIATRRGYEVVASASARNHDYMRELGATHVVDYHDEDWQEQVLGLVPGGVDATVAIHPGTPLESQQVVKDGGTIVAVSGDQLTPERGIVLKQVFNDVDVERELVELIGQASTGQLQRTVAGVHPFREALAVLEQVCTRHTRGKLVLSMGSDPTV